MPRFWLALCSLLLIFNCTLCLDVNQIRVPTDDGISGVFLIQTKDKKYSFNAMAAAEACNTINMRIATKAEVETANNNGLQTCRFGWVEEQIAVIPRTEKSEKCGQNKLGIIVWRTEVSRLFDVYCFKTADPGEPFKTTTSRGLEPTAEGAKTPSTSYSSSPSTHPSSIQSSSSPVRSLPPYSSTPSVSSAVSTSSITFITVGLSSTGESSQATAYPHPRTPNTFSTSPASASSHSSTNTVPQHTSPSTGQLQLSQSATPNRPSMRAGTKTLVIVSMVLLLLLGAAGTAWYLKIKRGQQLTSWTRMTPKHIAETEMWRHITERHCVREQMSKDNNNRKRDNIILQMEQDPDPDSL